MSKLCKWEVLRSNSYSASYKCMNCGAFHEEFGDGDSIILPPLRECYIIKPKELKGKCNIL